MEDLRFKGQMFTWTNNRRGSDGVRERLDRTIINHAWATRFPTAQCTHEIIIGSDNAPISLHLAFNDRRGPKPFRFEEMWFEKVDCQNVIRRAWEVGGAALNISDIGTKLARCSSALTTWSTKEFKHNLGEIRKVKQQI